MSYISFQPKDYFNTKLYTGNGSTQSISSVGFQPDWCWLKGRSGSGRDHLLFDAIRGATNYIKSNATSAEATISSTLTSFDSDGFSIGSNGGVNANSETFVSWNWLANGAGSSNTDGSITSTVSASTTSGFSIVQWTGDGTTATIGHGLNAVPKMIITKRTDTSDNWYTYHSSLGNTKYILLEASDAQATSSGAWNNTSPTSSVFTKASATNVSGGSYIAYCFAQKSGFSSMGSYVGNGSADGSFIYLGMSSSFIMIKRTDAVSDWFMYDVTRDPLNPNTFALRASGNNAEVNDVGYSEHDHLSNGIKLRQTWDGLNASGGTYIYMAFAEAPIVSSNGVPATAR